MFSTVGQREIRVAARPRWRGRRLQKERGSQIGLGPEQRVERGDEGADGRRITAGELTVSREDQRRDRGARNT